MVCIRKKRITSELLHIALVLTMLNGDLYNNRRPQEHYVNEANVTDYNIGPSWAYMRTPFHQESYYEPSRHHAKSIMDIYEPDFEPELVPNMVDDMEILNQMRAWAISRTNSLTKPRKSELPFQSFTAYLVSNTTNGAVPNGVAPAIPVVTNDSQESALESSAAPTVPSQSDSEEFNATALEDYIEFDFEEDLKPSGSNSQLTGIPPDYSPGEKRVDGISMDMSEVPLEINDVAFSLPPLDLDLELNPANVVRLYCFNFWAIIL